MNKRNEKKQNLTMIIEMLRRYGAMTQARLKEYCSLQASTVSYLVSDLKQYGVIKDSGAEVQQQPKIGKPGNVIELDNSDSQFLGMYVEDEFIDVYLIGIDGKTINEERILMDGTSVKETVMRTVKKRISANPHISGIGIAIKAIVYKDGTVKSAQRSGPDKMRRNWSFSGLLSGLQRAYPQIPIIVENDANCIAELYNYNCKREKKDIVVYLMNKEPFGIGCGLLMDGRLYRGARGAAGEFSDSASVIKDIDIKNMDDRFFLETIIKYITPYVMGAAAFLDPECIVFTGSCLNGLVSYCEELISDISAKTGIPMTAESVDILNPAKGAALLVIDKYVSNLVNEVAMG